MAIFGQGQIDVAPEAIQLLNQLRDTTNDPGVLNIYQRVGSGEFGPGPLSLQDVIGIGRRLLPGRWDLLTGQGSGGAPTTSQDYASMSDADLLSLASQRGIDASQFNAPEVPFGGALTSLPNVPTEFGPISPRLSIGEDVKQRIADFYQPQLEDFRRNLARESVELAGQRGLRIIDADIPQRVAEALSRGEASFAGQRAQAELAEAIRQQGFGEQANLARLAARESGLFNRANFLENQRQFENTLGLQRQGQQQNFALAAKQFQESLRQQAQANRLALAGLTGQSALGLGNARMGFDTGAARAASNPFQFLAPSLGLQNLQGGIQNTVGGFQRFF